MTINVSISPDLEQFVSEQVAGGHYPSVDDVVRESLQALREKQKRLESLRLEIDLGLEDLAAGRMEIFDDKLMEEILADEEETIRDSLRHEIDLGLEDSAAGRTEIFDAKVAEELIAKSRARRNAIGHEQTSQPDPDVPYLTSATKI